MLTVLSCDVCGDLVSVRHSGLNLCIPAHGGPWYSGGEIQLMMEASSTFSLSVVVMLWGHDLTGGISKSL